jgi:hypothetical protein
MHTAKLTGSGSHRTKPLYQKVAATVDTESKNGREQRPLLEPLARRYMAQESDLGAVTRERALPPVDGLNLADEVSAVGLDVAVTRPRDQARLETA